MSDYVPDKLYERLFQPWSLHPSEWPLCKEDWARVDAITRLPWKGTLLDYGCGDGTLAAMVASRNPSVDLVGCVDEHDKADWDDRAGWQGNGWPLRFRNYIREVWTPCDGALCCEVLEHMTEEEGQATLKQIRAVMKPGAMLCVTVPWEHGSRAEYPGHITKFSWALLGKMLRDAGFTLDEKLTTDIKGIWLMAIADA